MKKLLILAIVLFMIPIAAADDGIDLTALSYAQLVDLQQRISAEIVTRPEWKEVTVPSGTWTVGKDIPAGEYSISATKTGGYLRIRDERGKLLQGCGIREAADRIGKVELKEGYTVEIERGSLIFAPAISLGF